MPFKSKAVKVPKVKPVKMPMLSSMGVKKSSKTKGKSCKGAM